jgi:hypothetical protein
MVITTTGVTGAKINFDKLYVSESGTKIDLSLEIPMLNVFNYDSLQFRLTTVGISDDSQYRAFKNGPLQGQLKRDVLQRNIPTEYVDIDFSFSDSALLRTTPDNKRIYRIGTFDIQHTQETFESRNIFVFCTRVAGREYIQNILELPGLLSSTFFPIIEGNEIYTPPNPDVLVLETSLNSLLRNALEVEPVTTESKPTAFSQLFPSIKDDGFNFLYFLDLRRVLENNSDLFSLLSESEQERAIESTIIKDQLFLKESNVKPTAPEFLNNALQVSQATGRTILNLPKNVIAFTGGDEIKEYSKNLKYNFNTNIIFLNGIYPVIERLINNIREIESFRSFMNGAFARTVFYNRRTQAFYRNGLPTLREDLRREFNSSKAQDYPDRIDYFEIVMKEIIQATAKFDSIFLESTVQQAVDQLRKLISLDENANTNEYSFELFFRFFDSLVKELQQVFLGVGFQLSGAFSGKGKSGSSTNPEKTLIKVKHFFGYEFKPEDYSLKYSYIDNTTQASFPTIPENGYRLLMNENVRKYFTSDTPTQSAALTIRDSVFGYSVVPTMNYLTVRSVKKRNEVVFDNTSPVFDLDSDSEMSEVQGAKSSYLTALNIIKNKLLSINIERLEELSPAALKARLYNAINEVYNLISFIPFPFDVNKSDDFRRETTDSILESAVSNDVLRPSEDENNEIIEAIYNLDEDFENLDELNATIENRLSVLTGFLDYVENLIEHPAKHDFALLDASLRNSDQFLKSISLISGIETVSGDGSIISEIRLPYPIYSLYETFQTAPAGGRITFFWAGRSVLENPLNSSLIRLNFANIKEIQALTGFNTLEDGRPNLASPVFEAVSPFGVLEPNSALFCKMSNYNIGYKNTMWYLNSNNLLGLKGETEHFLMINVEPGPEVTTELDSEEASGRIGALTQDGLEDAVGNFGR